MGRRRLQSQLLLCFMNQLRARGTNTKEIGIKKHQQHSNFELDNFDGQKPRIKPRTTNPSKLDADLCAQNVWKFILCLILVYLGPVTLGHTEHYFVTVEQKKVSQVFCVRTKVLMQPARSAQSSQSAWS